MSDGFAHVDIKAPIATHLYEVVPIPSPWIDASPYATKEASKTTSDGRRNRSLYRPVNKEHVMTVFIDVEEGDEYSLYEPGFEEGVWAVRQTKRGFIILQHLRTDEKTIVNCHSFAEMLARSSAVRAVGYHEQQDRQTQPQYPTPHGPESQQDGANEGITDA